MHRGGVHLQLGRMGHGKPKAAAEWTAAPSPVPSTPELSPAHRWRPRSCAFPLRTAPALACRGPRAPRTVPLPSSFSRPPSCQLQDLRSPRPHPAPWKAAGCARKRGGHSPGRRLGEIPIEKSRFNPSRASHQPRARVKAL